MSHKTSQNTWFAAVEELGTENVRFPLVNIKNPKSLKFEHRSKARMSHQTSQNTWFVAVLVLGLKWLALNMYVLTS